MAINYYGSFIKKLEELFMMDHAELDFGIYRIMNQKRQEIQHFLEVDLLPQVQKALSADVEKEQIIKKRLQEIEKQLGGNIDNLPESIPLVVEYKSLKKQLAEKGDTESMQNEVFSHLVTFFSRYYDEGDFMSKRRYKDNTYSVPYNGEEMKLYWANADQYYIKTSEYFRNYTFVLPTSRRKVHFVLKEASTEQNDKKEQKNKERRFALYEPEEGKESFIEETSEGDLNVYFTYELKPKSIKQKELCNNALNRIAPLVPEAFEELLSVKVPTKDNECRSLLEKHLTDYTAKNTFDYFIHKNLGDFLNRELDFYIKNEVLHIDDLDSQHIQSHLSIVNAIKQVGRKIIIMLAQLENFQKTLWLKKKFVVQSDYCITLDRVSEALYPQIVANEEQRKEWVRLFAIDEISGDGMFTHGYTEPLSLEFLHENPYLVLDTKFFDVNFKHSLVAGIDNLDWQCNGLLINSENFQALQLLQEKYQGIIKCAYYDPPFNTSEGTFIYKNSYQQSSWCSMIENRLALTRPLLSIDGVAQVAIDDFEQPYLSGVLDDIFGFENRLGTLVVEIKPSGRTNDFFLATSHEYLLCYAKNHDEVSINFIPLTEKQKKAYKETGEDGTANKWRDFLRTGGYSTPEERPNSYYPIYYNPDTNDITPNETDGYIKILPIDSAGKHRVWRKISSSLEKHLQKGEIKVERQGDVFKVRIIDKIKDGVRPKSVWIGSKYDAATHGTKLIKHIFGESGFSFPKAFGTVYDSINMVCDEGDIILDAFAGSGTTGHAVVDLNRRVEDECYRFILCEVNDYFETVTKPRIEKVIYSEDWNDGKPVSRQGISQCFKYIRLEQYEDTLNNLEVKKQQTDWKDPEFHEDYMLSYMLDSETRDSLLNLNMFDNPFVLTLNTAKENEMVTTTVDMVETFNYLIGLNVEKEEWYQDNNICVIRGRTHREGLKTLIIWRNCKVVDNESLNVFFNQMGFRSKEWGYDIIYVNGDNSLPGLRRDEEHWKVVLIEEEFQKRMFEGV